MLFNDTEKKSGDTKTVCEEANIKEWFLKQVHKVPLRSNSPNPFKKISFDTGGKDVPNKCSKYLGGPLTVTLQEIETVWFLTIISSYQDDVTTDTSCSPIEISAKPIKKCLHAESQTPKSSEKAKGSETIEVKTTSSFVNASAWDLYDTYAQVGGEEGLGIKEFQLLIDTALKSRGVIQLQPGVGSEFTRMPADQQMKRLMKYSNFNYCVLAIERLLASKTFEKKQSLLKTPSLDKFAAVSKTTFSYQISLLWTYDNHFETAMAVTSLDWNSKNPSLLAVGYGQLTFSNEEEGCVCLWSPKNPSHPERKLQVPYSVTTLCFSTDHPNILAVGTRSGYILLIDVANMEKIVQLLPRDKEPSKFGPIWKMRWYFQQSAVGAEENLMFLSDAGVLSNISLSSQKSSEDIIKLNYTLLVTSDEKCEGYEPNKVFCLKSLSGLDFSLVANEFVCYIASSEGVIIKCNIRSPSSVGTEILAHIGPVYVIQHSPATSRVFLTCGADHCLKIWVDGITEPLVTLISAMQMPMVDASWSPIHPTIIASLTNTELAIWDISQNTTEPVNSFRLRSSDQTFTNLKFAPDGQGLVVGDHLGHVKLYQLREVPRTPFLAKEALTSALLNAVASNFHLLKVLKKLTKAYHTDFCTNILDGLCIE